MLDAVARPGHDWATPVASAEAAHVRLGPTWSGATQGEVTVPDRARWSLGRQMAAVLVALAVLTGLQAALVIQSQDKVTRNHSLSVARLNQASDVLFLQTDVATQAAALEAYIATKEPGPLQTHNLAENQVLFDLELLGGDAVTASDRAAVAQIHVVTRNWQRWADKRSAQVGTTQVVDASEAATGDLLLHDFTKYTTGFQQSANELATQSENAALAQSRFQGQVVTVAAGIGLLAFVLLGFLFMRGTLHPISNLVDVAVRLASGRRSAIPAQNRNDEVGQLAKALAAWDRSVQERLMLARAMVDVNSHAEPEEVVMLGTQRMQEELGAAQVMVTLARGGEWRVAAATPNRYPSETLLTSSPEAETLGAREILFRDMRSSSWDGAIRDWQGAHGYGPVMCIPMISGGQLLGVVSAIRTLNMPPFSALDKELAEIVVPPMAAAIHVSLLYGKVTELDGLLHQSA